MRAQTGAVRSIPPLKINSDLVLDDRDKANSFNEAYAGNFVLDDGNTPTLPANITYPECDNVTVTTSRVHSLLGLLKTSHAVGPDGFSAYFYKLLRNELCQPLAFIFKFSISSCTLPKSWKSARIIPIYKKGDASDPINYRPISLTCVPCKVLERIIRDHMFKHLNNHFILSKDQFGFLPGRSTTLQLLECMDDWTRAVDSGSPVDIIFIDFAKAFDSVVHNKLFYKLHHYGFTGNLLTWIKSFLTNRTQTVCVGSSVSNAKPVISGVPQGSVLGPLLFVTYINDLNCSNEVMLPKFADDTKLYKTIQDCSDRSTLFNAIGDVVNWCNEWQLPISFDKCKVLHVGRKNLNFNYTIGNHNLESVSSVKDLGVVMSEDLKVSNHINTIVSSARMRAIFIRRCFKSQNISALVRAFKVFVRPILEYASPVWCPHLQKDIDLLESVQRRFTKLLPGMYHKSYKERLEACKLPSLELRRLLIDLILTYSLLHNAYDVDCSRYFNIRGCERTRGHPFKLRVNISKTDCRKFFFCNRVVNVWNQLPASVVLAKSVSTFKRLLYTVDFSSFLTF